MVGTAEKDVLTYQVGANYFETMGLQLRQGRFFDAQRNIEDATAVIVNQRLVDLQNWANPVGQSFRKDGQTYNVVGVAENFKVAGFSKTLPAVFFRGTKERFNYLTVRCEQGANQSVEDFAKKSWAKLYPDSPFNFFYQELIFDGFYQRFYKVSSIFRRYCLGFRVNGEDGFFFSFLLVFLLLVTDFLSLPCYLLRFPSSVLYEDLFDCCFICINGSVIQRFQIIITVYC